MLIICKSDIRPPTAPVLGTPTAVSTTSLSVPLTTAATDLVGVTSYALERATSAGGTYSVLSSNATFPYVDTGLTASTTYYYRAAASDAAGNVGSYSAIVSGTTQAESTGSANYAGLTPNKYVSSTGSNSNNGNTEGTAYATIAFALSQITAGQVVGVVNNISENIAWNSWSGGSAGSANHKVIVGKTMGSTMLTGSSGGTNASANLTLDSLILNVGTSEGSSQDAQNIVFRRCGFTGGGGTSSGNVVQWVSGSNQAYHGCYWDGTGGRYCLVVFNVNNVLLNECVFRTQANVWGPPGSNPTGGCTIYSSTNVDVINCIAVDCLNQGNGAEWLGGFNLVANVGNQTGVTLRQCIVRYLKTAGLIGMQFDGANSMTASVIDCCSVDCNYGLVIGTHFTSASNITITGGEYSSNTNYGVADFGASSSTASNVNTTANGLANFSGISGTGNTTSALNMSSRTSAWKRYGSTYGLLRGESGWNTQTANSLWTFPNEDAIRTRLAVISTRGFCAVGQTLSGYVRA